MLSRCCSVCSFCRWLRCNKKSAGRAHRHGSITKVALTGNIMNGIPGETSKLLSTDTYGRSVMNPYEQVAVFRALSPHCAKVCLADERSRKRAHGVDDGPVPASA